MAETAATAFGIAGGVAVLQSLLQCYKDILTARDFGDDFVYLQLRTALLDSSTSTWAAAVRVFDDSGAELKQFDIQNPTANRGKLAATTLRLASQRLKEAKDQLDTYTEDRQASDASNPDNSRPLVADANNSDDRPARTRRIANKLHRSFHRQHDNQHPGTWKRTEWALINKERLEEKIAQVAELVDQLNTNFAPANQNQHLENYYEKIKALELSKEDIKAIGEAAADKLSQTAMKMYEGQVLTGNRLHNVKVSDNGMVNVGDYFHESWKDADTPRQQTRNEITGDTTVEGQATVNVGNRYGGESFVQQRL